MYKAFTEATGTKVSYTGTQDINSIVQSRVQAGNPPEIADLQIGVAQGYAEQGKLMNLSDVIGTMSSKRTTTRGSSTARPTMARSSASTRGSTTSCSGTTPSSTPDPRIPTTWKEIVDWTDAEAAKGTPAWCLAQEAGGGSGFPGAQFIENLFAKKYGPEKLRAWGAGELAWTSPEVKDAWEMYGAIANDNSKVSGGTQGALSAAIATGYNGLIAQPATCQIALWGSWVPGLIGSGVEPGKNMDFFRIPGDGDNGSTEIFQTTVAVAFDKSPTTEAFMRFIESTEAQALLASADQWPVANVNVPTDTYGSELLQKSAETFFGNDVTLSIGPNVMSDAAVASAFYKGVVSYMQDPSQLDAILAEIQAAQTGS